MYIEPKIKFKDQANKIFDIFFPTNINRSKTSYDT